MGVNRCSASRSSMLGSFPFVVRVFHSHSDTVDMTDGANGANAVELRVRRPHEYPAGVACRSRAAGVDAVEAVAADRLASGKRWIS